MPAVGTLLRGDGRGGSVADAAETRRALPRMGFRETLRRCGKIRDRAARVGCGRGAEAEGARGLDELWMTAMR